MNTVPRSHPPFLQPFPFGWSQLAAALAGSALSIGCGQPAAEEAPRAQLQQKGVSLQGMSLQGMSLQGTSLQGMSLQGMSLQGTSLQGMSLQGISLQGSTLTTSTGTPLVAGAVLLVKDDLGNDVQLRISATQADAQDATGETTVYAMEAWDAAAGTWQSICAPDPWGQRWVIPVLGRWDARGKHEASDSTYTLACTSGVIAKCVRWGYKPWRSVNGVSLAPYHQACTRMARADYCGDGTSHTQNGTMIDMYDTIGIQTRTEGVNMYFEAAWTPDGAYCIGKERWLGLGTYDRSSDKCYAQMESVTTVNLNDAERCYVRLPRIDRREIVLRNRSSVNTVESIALH